MQRLSRLFAGSAVTAVSYQVVCQGEDTQQQRTTPVFKTRKQHIQEVKDNNQYDVLVIGGGCNGVGVLLDASTRGLRTLLIDRDDFGAGASSKSTKLIHGGVRYLQQVFDFSFASLSSRVEKFNLVKQSIIERGLMIDSASHLTTKIPFVVPCTNIFSAVYYYVGSLVYYGIYRHFTERGGNGVVFKRPYFLNRGELTEIFPHLNPKYSNGVVYEDGSFNDARMLLAAILTATVGNGLKMPASFIPGNAINRAQFIDFLKNKEGTIQGAIFKDLLTNKEYTVKAKHVVNCTGVWSDKIRQKDDPSVNKRICLVGGSHVVYDNKVASPTHGIAAPSSDGRVVLIQPWMGRVLAGTTEKKIDEPTNHPTCSDEERKFINDSMMGFMSELEVGKFLRYEKTRWCGIRPLVADNADELDTKTISRSHVIEEQKSGLLSLMGGKWTIYRKMGEDLVDVIMEKERKQGREVGQSQTKGLPLLGSANESIRSQMLKQKGDIGVELYHSFGWLAKDAIKGDLTRVYGSTTIAELQWIVNNELVSSIQDVLMRRTRLCFLIPKTDFLPLARLVGQMLQTREKWSSSRTEQQIDTCINNLVGYEFE